MKKNRKRPIKAAPKRGYSRDFPVNGDGERYLVDQIPAALWRAVKAKARREGRSVRNIALQALADYLDE
jgi:hypothetical protein